MKSKKEIQKYLGNYKIGLFDLITIQGYLQAKGIEANFALGDGKNITATSFIEWFESETKELELIEREFYTYTEPNGNIWIYQYRKWTTRTSHFFALIISNDNLYENGTVDGIEGEGIIKIATLQQKQLLIDKVKEKIGKIWNEETKTFEAPILIPENIKIIKYQNNQLGLVFNDNKQVLTLSEGVYIVMPFDNLDKFISCMLEKTTFEKLEIGNIFCIDDNIEHEHNYRVKISDSIS